MNKSFSPADTSRRILEYICDKRRHLVCKPYTIKNLHIMAKQLDIHRCWFHKTHYDIPFNRIAEITAKCTLVESRDIVLIIRNGAETR